MTTRILSKRRVLCLSLAASILILATRTFFEAFTIDATASTGTGGSRDESAEMLLPGVSNNADDPISSTEPMVQTINTTVVQSVQQPPPPLPSQSQAQQQTQLDTEIYNRTVHNETPRFAAIFLVAGCDPCKPTHRGFLHTVAMASYMLREAKTIDVHIMIRMSGETNATELDKEEVTFLEDANVTIRYLPKVKTDSFYTAMMAKFAVLEYTEYDRVLFMDADVLPMCNLEYLLQASYDGKLKSNVVLRWMNEPASGGFFILKPGGKKRLDEIVANQVLRQKNTTEFFDEKWGWGQEMYLPWVAEDVNGTDWTFYGVHADQGLLHYWTLYEQQDVTQISRFGLTHFGSMNGKAYIEREEESMLKPCLQENESLPYDRFPRGLAPYSDFYHFSGRDKPWMRDIPETEIRERRAPATGKQKHPRRRRRAHDHPLRVEAVFWQSIRLTAAEAMDTTFPPINTTWRPPLGGISSLKQLRKIHNGHVPRAWRRRKESDVLAEEQLHDNSCI